MDINLDLITTKNYPNSTILGINETFYPNEGWVNKGNSIVLNQPIDVLKTIIKLRIANGATNFNFIVKDEFDQIRYPDYSAKELIVA